MRLATALSLLLVLVGWSVTSPLGSSPDDDYHLASIWCSELSYLHPCEQVAGPNEETSVLVPAVLIESHVCFAFQPGATANCVDRVQDTLRLTDRINQVQGLYPGGFYLAMSGFASQDYVTSVFVMRMVNALIVVLFLGAFLFLGRPALTQSALLVLPVMFIPLAVFLFASTNPSSWTVAGSVFYFLFGLNAIVSSPRSAGRIASLVLAVASAVIAMSSRVDASAFIVVITVALALHVGWQGLLRSRAVAATLLATGIAAGVFFFLQGLGPAGSSTTIGESKYVGGLLFTNVLEIPGFLGGAVGGTPLGWLDTRLPGLVTTVGLIAVGAVAFWGLASMGVRKSISASFLVFAAFGIPVALAQQQRIPVLEFVQARYLLPLLIVLLLVLALTMPPQVRERFPTVPHATLTTLLAASGMAALWINFHRYAYGSFAPFFARDLEVKWSGLIGSFSMVLLVAGIVATVTFVFSAMWSYRLLSRDENMTENSIDASTVLKGKV